MGSVDFDDLDEAPAKTAGTINTLAANATHLARLLNTAQYPPA